MAETVSVRCGLCHNQFQVKSELIGRQVHCPACQTVVKVRVRSSTAQEALQSIGQELAEQKKATGGHRPPVVLAKGGVRSRGLAILWLGILAVVLIGCVFALLIVFGPLGKMLNIHVQTPATPEQQTASSPAPAVPMKNAPTTAGGKPFDAKAGTAPAAAPAAAPQEPPEPVVLKVGTLVSGFADNTVTYAVGRVTNNMPTMIKAIKVTVSLMDNDSKALGDATAIILNIPPGATAPLVAEWKHEEGIHAGKYTSGYQLNPVGVSQDRPLITVEDSLPIRDPNSFATTGKVKLRATNQGSLPVPQVNVFGVLVDKDGKIAGVVRGIVDVDGGLVPKKPAEIRVPWDHCPGNRVDTVEMWVQPTF